MDKFQKSWQLFKSSLAVMAENKKLLLFPIIITTFTGIIAVLFLAPVAFQRTGYEYESAQHWKAVGNSIYNISFADNGGAQGAGHHGTGGFTIKGIRPLAMSYFAAAYFVSMFFATFFNVAFYKEILNALSGQAVSIRGGMRFALSKWKIILMWTLFAGLVGFIIKSLEQRFGFVGQWILRILGAVWSVACVFVIPVIITEEETTNPFVVLKKSALTLTQTWGESLIGYVGVNLGGSIIFLVTLAWLGAGIFVSVLLHSYWLAALAVVSWLAAVFILSYLTSVASQIFRCALFLYATQGALPGPFTEEMAAGAWKLRKN